MSDPYGSVMIHSGLGLIGNEIPSGEMIFHSCLHLCVVWCSMSCFVLAMLSMVYSSVCPAGFCIRHVWCGFVSSLVAVISRLMWFLSSSIVSCRSDVVVVHLCSRIIRACSRICGLLVVKNEWVSPCGSCHLHVLSWPSYWMLCMCCCVSSIV